MNGVAGGRLAAAVSNAGGLGLVGGGYIDFEASATQLGMADPLPTVPLLVLVHTPGQGDYLIPGGRLIVAENSSHGMVFTSPDLVIDAVHQVIEAVRDPSTWAASATPMAATPAP